jgi:serine protease AprX
VSLLLIELTAVGQNKKIRLRNETILTPPRTNVANMTQSLAPQAAASGLFLIQFDGAPDPAARAQLKADGVELLKYVPDDAYLATFSHANLGTIRALEFVRWVGPYRPEHKLHPRLVADANAAARSNRTVAVSILLSPQADPSELAQVHGLLARVHHESHLRQGTILSGELPPASLDALAQSSAVVWVERMPKRKLVDEAAAKLVGGDDGLTGTPTVTQQLGFGGAGVTVCVADTGLDSGNTNTMHPDLKGRVTGFQAYGTIPDGSDGYGHGTHAAGIVAGNAATGETDPDTGAFYGLGVASQANLFIERIFDDDANMATPFPSNETLARDAVRHGAQIGSNSWGNDNNGEYDLDASQFDELVRDADLGTLGDQSYILEFSAGNAGPGSQTMDSPACGKNVLATGASENVPGTLAMTYGLYAEGSDTMCDFSSRGPCEDGRLKPDVVAPGSWIASAASQAALNLASVSWTVIDDYYVYMGGTSMSGPAAAGSAAIFVQYYRSTHTNAMPSPALVKAALINSADPLDDANGGPGPIPNNDEGWGRINLPNVIVTNVNAAPRYYQYLDQSVLLGNGQVYTQHAFVRSSSQSLKITLAYTDVAGFPGAIPALVNDLDLEVVGPDGTLYRGNQFVAGESLPNPSASDTLNNVEGVHLAQPLPGDYLVRIRARNVVEDARLDTTAIDQDFALVVSGDLARPGAGLILLNRTNYTAPSTVQLAVLDQGRAGSSSVNVVLKSTTEPAGETYVLRAAGSYGAFTGAVATVIGAASLDGKLELHDNDAIEADYVDVSGSTRSAFATAQLVPPVVTGVTATSDLGIISILWQTSEPANSIVRYGTSSNFNLAVTNTDLTTSHAIKLIHLIPGQTYYFYVSSTDAAGNTTTNSNSGAYFSFVAVAAPTVLLVDDYDSTGEDDAGSIVISDGVYTNALTAAGFSYGFWKVNQRGYPKLADLQGFPVVIWRTTDDIVNYEGTNNTLSAQQQFMIQSYLDGGGSFFMASMSILSQLGNVPFRKNVLQVGGFVQNPDPPSPCSECDEDFSVEAVSGAPGNPLTGGMAMVLDYSQYPSFDLSFGDEPGDTFGPDFSDTFTPATNATAIFFEAASGKACGTSYPRIGVDSPGRVVFLSFPLDTLPLNGPSPNNETAVLQRILNFLLPGANGVGTLTLNNTVYTAPDQMIVEMGDSDLAGSGQATATFATSSSANCVTVTLFETAHPGLFRGTLTLVGTNATANQLTVRNGDVLTVTYFDASNNRNVVATATVDATAPVLTQVAATTAFVEAEVSWASSKPADSLVQYGESTLLNRTAYSSTLVTNHTITVGGLFPNHVYYYQVVSRDQAGNTTVNDNQGKLYTFQTIPAPRPPWSDDLESGAPGWTVKLDSGAAPNWQLGTPQNDLQTSAYSGHNAWGSNLKGADLSSNAGTLLFTPVIDLSGFNQATLTFWTSYDFASSLEFGQLGVTTDINTPPANIPTIVDYSGSSALGWEEETVDLTPYVGKSIYVVWYYAGFSFLGPLNGWLVDDVSITGVAGGGTIIVTKNLGQGKFTLTGPFNQYSGTLPVTTITNAVTGVYTVDFDPANYYQTPASQSGTLTNGGTLNFTGNYTFIDLNHNGISDAWEKDRFGAVSFSRTQSTDTDGDGMSDYAEFIAGTDPTNAASKLTFLSTSLQSNKRMQVQWSAIPGRLYQLTASSTLAALAPAKLSGSLDKASGRFKLHIDAQTNAPYAIQVSTNLTVWTSISTNTSGGKLDFMDALRPARGFYRTMNLASTNFASWTPISDWMQATASPMSYTVTNLNQGSQFFRVMVRP